MSWALDAATATGLRPVVLVVGHRAATWSRGRATEACGRRAGATAGAAASPAALRAALGALEPYAPGRRALCVGLADQPLVGAEAYRRLAVGARGRAPSSPWRRTAGCGGTRCCSAGRLWPEARALDGDVGARALMGRHEVVEVDCTGTGEPRDVDTLDDLRAIEASMEG